MWASRFEQLIADKATWSKTNMLEIVTWNGAPLSLLLVSCHVLSSLPDFGESHYLTSPHSQGDVPPGADKWTNGFDHSVRLTFSSERDVEIWP
jgi:hypothetical protein